MAKSGKKLGENPKERSIAFLAGHAVAFAQFAQAIDVRTLWGHPDPFIMTDLTWDAFAVTARAALFPVGCMIIPALGMLDAYRALELAGSQDSTEQQKCASHLGNALFFGLLVVLLTILMVTTRGFFQLMPPPPRAG